MLLPRSSRVQAKPRSDEISSWSKQSINCPATSFCNSKQTLSLETIVSSRVQAAAVQQPLNATASKHLKQLSKHTLNSNTLRKTALEPTTFCQLRIKRTELEPEGCTQMRRPPLKWIALLLLHLAIGLRLDTTRAAPSYSALARSYVVDNFVSAVDHLNCFSNTTDLDKQINIT